MQRASFLAVLGTAATLLGGAACGSTTTGDDDVVTTTDAGIDSPPPPMDAPADVCKMPAMDYNSMAGIYACGAVGGATVPMNFTNGTWSATVVVGPMPADLASCGMTAPGHFGWRKIPTAVDVRPPDGFFYSMGDPPQLFGCRR